MKSETSETPPGRQRRRRCDSVFKRAIVEQTLAPGVSVARIAHEHDINANQLFKWRRQFLLEEPAVSRRGETTPSAISLLPVSVVAEEPASVASTSATAPSQLRQIEIMLAGGTVRVDGVVDGATLQLVLLSLCR